MTRIWGFIEGVGVVRGPRNLIGREKMVIIHSSWGLLIRQLLLWSVWKLSDGKMNYPRDKWCRSDI